MVSKFKGKKSKIIALLATVVMVIGILVGPIYSTNDNHYVVDVIKESASATTSDNSLQLTEKIVKGANQQYFDSKQLNYEVELKNITQESKVENQVAIVIDSSYSMQTNDTNNVVKAKAIELAEGILDNVKNARISVSNNSARKRDMTSYKTAVATNKNNIRNTINGLVAGEGSDSNQGLNNAVSSFVTSLDSNARNRYIIVFTDSTDDVSAKMQELASNPDTKDIKIISILVDMISNSYISNNTTVNGDVYMLLSELTAEDITDDVNILDLQKIYDDMNKTVNTIEINNTFSDEILTYFNISDIQANVGTVEKTETGYKWNVERIKYQETAKLTYSIELRTNMDINAGLIFEELYTNKTQDIKYTTYENEEIQTLNGTDSREGTESTVIKICQGYDLKIKAVNESNTDLHIEGIEFTVVGTNENNEEVCKTTKETDSDGYITITPEDARALRGNGIITFTVSPTVNKVGYVSTDSVTFKINSNKETKKIEWVDIGTDLEYSIREDKRLLEVIVPINSQRVDLELKVSELNNNNVVISGAEFELIQPKLNNRYEMDVLTGRTDENGTIHFSPTVMTKDGTYNYILRQVSAPQGYDVTVLTLITIDFKDAKITSAPATQFNPNVVKTELVKENHALIEIGNECVAQDPFNIQINLQDSVDGTKLEGVTYLIRTINSNNVSRSEFAKTDTNGQINATVYGNGNLRIEITEQSPKVGYKADEQTKQLIVNRDNKIITIWNTDPTDLLGNIDQSPNKEDIIVNLYSQKKVEQNIVELNIVDSQEIDVAVGAGIVYELTEMTVDKSTGTMTAGRTYREISDRNGKIKFTIDTQPQGEHIYLLEVDSNLLPQEYNNTKNETQIILNLTFDKDGFIIGESIGNGSELVIEDHCSRIENGEFVEHTAFIKIGFEMNTSNTVEFKVQLSDKDNIKTKLEGASYNINIEWDINGTTRTKTITGRKTNTKGEITTRIIKGDEVRISVTQVGAKVGYNVDNTTQEIYLTFNNNGTVKIDQTPYDLGTNNTSEPNQGAKEVSGVIIYQHLNKKRTTEDTYLNLTINKKDIQGAYRNGVILNLKSATLKDKNDNTLGNDFIVVTGTQGSDGTVTIDYEKYLQDHTNNQIIRVPGIGIEGKEVVHNLEITEMAVDSESSTGYKEKPGTTVRLRLTYRYKDNRVILTNVETIYGNRLVENKIFSSASDSEEGQYKEDTMGVYLSNVLLDIYTDYDEVGNLSLDLKKQNQKEVEISGAKYTLKVINPDNTVIIKENIEVSNGQNSSDIEISGLSVSVGSIIELTETKAPIGYEVNRSTETLEVTKISEDGAITLEQKDVPYSPNRLKMEKLASSITTAGKLKTNYELTFTDYELNVFEFEVETKDRDSQQGIGGFGFKIDSNKGATSSLKTGSNGVGTTRIGGNGEDETITYTITLNSVAEYYKPIKNTIKVNVVYNNAGTVDITATQNAQTDPNYGTLWEITNINDTGFGKIGIQILVEHQDPLVVKIQTIDTITNANVNEVSYKITPSEELPATGSNSIDVGYAIQNGPKTYNIEQTSIKNSYEKIGNKTFKVEYQNETLTNAIFINNTETQDTITITGKKQITIKLYVEPKVPFEFTNLAYFDQSIKLQGANFEVISQRNQESATGTTDANGKVGIYSDIFMTDQDVIYKIRQTKAATEYATVEDFYVKVTYNANREITAAELVDQSGTSVTNNKFITVSVVKTSSYSNYNSNNKGIVTIKVLNYPEFKINIENVDRRDGTTPIVGTEYSVKSTYVQSDNTIRNFTQTSGVLTNSDGIGIAHLDKTKENKVVTYTITETKPATGYQSLGTEIQVEVTFDGEGYVSSVQLVNQNNLSNIANVSKIDPVVNIQDNFIVNLQLKNNPILKFNITTQDSMDPTIKIKDIGFTMVSKTKDNKVYSNSSATNRVNQSEKPEMSQLTDTNGYTALYMDRTLENKDMYYTIKEVQKSAGYEWIDQDVIIKVAYDSNGKISTVAVTQGANFVNTAGITFDSENFEISLEIYNDEIKEFGIYLTATDTYDKDKKLNNMKVEAFLTEEGNNSYTSDGEYEFIADNSLLTGADRDGDGTPDLRYGEDYKTMGQYTKGAGTRTLRLIIKNDSHTVGQTGYYLDSYDGSASGNSIGYYKASDQILDAKYQTVKYQYLINVTFDDEGKITNTQLLTGLNSNIGWLTDNRYVDISIGGNYKLNITLKFFPMFDLNLNAMDNYTYQNEIDKDGKPISLSGAKFTVSTTRHYGYTEKQDYIEAGYIGNPQYYGIHSSAVYGEIYESTDRLLTPIGNNEEKLFYVFEEIEPTNYQKTNPWHMENYHQRLISIIKVKFNEYGEIDYDNSIVREVDGNIIKPYMAENGTSYLSSNNIPEYNYYYNKTIANRNINFYIGYALTTKINITAVDDISGNPISNIRINPFINSNYCTNKFYHYTTIGYKDTNNNGYADFKYWGAATTNNVNQYIISASRYSNNYNGYLFPSDMAQSSIGGSGNQADYYAKLDVTYGEDGKISNVKSLGSDLWGDDNIGTDISWDSTTGNINIKMLFSRKFQMTLMKVDYYDKTINNLTATFDIISNKGLTRSITSRNMTPIGKIYKDTTVKYTLSETQVPSGYYPLTDTIDYYVTFDKHGNISSNTIKSSSEYFEVVNTSQNTEDINKTSPDLTINIKNKPAFNLDLKVIDKFYKNDGLTDVYFNITNSKGDIALGNPQTDSNGYAKVVTGPVYPGETVKYYITQTNTVSGYYQNSTKIELEVEFNNTGKVQSYKIISGNEVINNFNTSAYMNKRQISMQIMNMPKDLKIGLYKYDKTTNSEMDSVQFTITREDMNSGAKQQKTITTEANGAIIQTIDTFATSSQGKTVKYTIHEDKTPETYRTMQDVVFIIRYNTDGSIASYNQIPNNNGILNTDVIPEIAIGTIKYLNSQRVHFLARVPNDNSYDVIIKNEDANYAELGIEGSKFDVSINGQTYSPKLTDTNGKTTIKDLTQSGDISIKIAQKEAGEGYKFDVDNTVEVNLEKGTDIYSLNLKGTTEGFIDDKNAETAKAIVEVDEVYGTITITFKNETKTELTLFKQDINTKVALQGAEFEVTAQQIDNDGNNIGDAITLTTEDNKITNDNGQIKFSLGVAPQSQIWVYTFKEITPPEGYNPIVDLTLTVTYDQYGRISEKMKSNKDSRLVGILEDQNNINCRDIYAILYSGDISPAYKVKVVTEDADTGKRISGSTIKVDITKEDRDPVIVEPKTSASAQNGVAAVTGNLGIDGKMYTDEQVKDPEESTSIIMETGLMYIDNIDYEGIINIDVSQQATANGYIYGNQKTEGYIKLKATYIPHLDNDPTVEFEPIENDGLKVNFDSINRTITITILNESQVLFDITTQQYSSKQDTTNVYIPGANYIITSEIQTSVDSKPTDLNATTPLTDEKGNTKQTVGKAYAGKTVVYTLEQNEPEGYKEIDNIQVEVQYDSRGYIKYYELLSSQDNAYIAEEKTDGRTISLQVFNRKELETYTVYVEKHAKDTENDLDAYGRTLAGAKYQITVEQQFYGPKTTTWVDVTDGEGLIKGITFDGYGRIKVSIEELESPEGYSTNSLEFIEIYRDADTGEIEEWNSNVNWNKDELDEKGNRIIKLIPVAEQRQDKFTLYLNKVSSETGNLITDNQAKFKVELIQKSDDETIIYKEELGIESTDQDGKIIMSNLNLPTSGGIYSLVLTEMEAPKGYVKLSDSIEIPITFDQTGEKVTISEVDLEGIDNVSVARKVPQLLALNIMNDIDYGIADNQYILNITKIDSETKKAITTSKAIFKLEDDKGNKEYIETDIATGKIQMPTYMYPLDSEFDTNSTVERNYTLTEIMAPKGYLIDSEPINIKITFTKGKDLINDSNNGNEITVEEIIEDEKVKIQNVEVVKGNEQIEETIENNIISFNVENEEGELTNNVDRGRYTINISKIDEETLAPITEHATFEITLENGEKVTASTDENGNIQIKDIKVPLTVTKNLGPYSYVIQETKAAEGYELINGYSIMELTFKKLIDPETGVETGFYGIDNITNVPTLTASQSATISSYTEEEVNIVITNKIGTRFVNYDANDNGEGTIVPKQQTKELGQDLTLDEMIPERSGYLFKGWASTKDATEAEYQPKDIYTIHENVTLYAIWEEILTLTSTEYQIVNAEMQVFGVASIGRKKIVYDQTQQNEYNDGDKYIIGILPQVGTPALKPEQKGTTVEQFINNFTTNGDSIKVYKKVKDADGTIKEQEAINTELVATNMIMEVKKGKTQIISLELAVSGDVNSSETTTDEDGNIIVINGDGILKQNDQSKIIEQKVYKADGEKGLIHSGMAFVIALDFELDGMIDNANKSKYLEYIPQRNTQLIKSLFPWNN